jgi:hypothetical protein
MWGHKIVATGRFVFLFEAVPQNLADLGPSFCRTYSVVEISLALVIVSDALQFLRVNETCDIDSTVTRRYSPSEEYVKEEILMT